MGFRCRTGNKPACRAASGCLLPGAAHSVASASRPGRRYWRATSASTPRLRTRPLFDWGNAAAVSRLLNQTEHAPDHGGTGGQQSSVKKRLLCGSTISGSMDRGSHPSSLVGWSVFDRRFAPVARGLGSDLAGCGFPAIALSINPLGAGAGGCVVAPDTGFRE